MISRGASWSRPALVMVLYLGLGAAALGWTTLRGQPTLWQVPGRSDPWVFTGITLGAAFGLAVVFASRLAFFRFEWARALHRDFRALLFPLGAGLDFFFARKFLTFPNPEATLRIPAPAISAGSTSAPTPSTSRRRTTCWPRATAPASTARATTTSRTT